MVEDSDEVKDGFNDMTKGVHEVLKAGVRFTLCVEQSFLPE